MPSRRILEKRSKLHSRLYIKAISQPKDRGPKSGRAAPTIWSRDFVVRDGSLCLDEILDSVQDREPRFIVLERGDRRVAVCPRELRRARGVLLADALKQGGKAALFRHASRSRTRSVLRQPALEAREQYRSAKATTAPWLRRTVTVDWMGNPREVGERSTSGLPIRKIVSRGNPSELAGEVVEFTHRITGPEPGSTRPILRKKPKDVFADADGRVRLLAGTRRPEPTPGLPNEPAPPLPPDGSAPGTGDPGTAEGSSIVRHPSITARETARPGELLLIDVTLLRQATDPDTESTGFRIDGLPEDWVSLPVHVHVACEHLEFEPGREQGTILVQREQESIGCMVAGRVSRECTADELVIVAVFSHNGRACTLAEARVPLAGVPAPEAKVEPSSSPEAAAGAAVCGIQPAAQGPALTVYIRPLSDSSTHGKLLWVLEPRDRNVPGLPRKLDDVIDLEVRPRTFVKRLLDQAGSRRKGMHTAMLESLGQLLYECAPPCFHETYWALRRANPDAPGFPIQFMCGEPHIPWELMYPYVEETGESAGFLFAEHPVGRWLTDYSGWMMSGYRRGRVLSITPDYERCKKRRSARMAPLPWAQREGRFLRQKVGALSVRPRFAEVIRLLQHGSAETVTMLHFAGHGSYDWARPEQSHIFLEDEELKAIEIRNSNFTLGRTHRPLVIFNACETGASGQVLDKVAGWATSFVHTRFGGFIAPLWSVYDDDAAELVCALVTRVMTDGVPVSVALQQLRREHAETSPTFLAYLYYGDVMARVA